MITRLCHQKRVEIACCVEGSMATIRFVVVYFRRRGGSWIRVLPPSMKVHFANVLQPQRFIFLSPSSLFTMATLQTAMRILGGCQRQIPAAAPAHIPGCSSSPIGSNGTAPTMQHRLAIYEVARLPPFHPIFPTTRKHFRTLRTAVIAYPFTFSILSSWSTSHGTDSDGCRLSQIQLCPENPFQPQGHHSHSLWCAYFRLEVPQ